MNLIKIEDIYFAEIKKCNYDSINGIIVFEILCKNNTLTTLTLTDVSNMVFIQSNKNEFDPNITFFPIEDVILSEGIFLSKNTKKEFAYNVIIDSCLSTWYIFSKKLILRNQSGETSVIDITTEKG